MNMTKRYYRNKYGDMSITERDTINMYTAFGDIDGLKRDYPELYEIYMAELDRLRKLREQK